MSEGKDRSDYRIMVVDDNSCNRKVAEQALTNHGYRVVTCESGFDALRFLKKEAADLIFLDLTMPDISGFETAAHIRRLRPPASQSSIIALSATITPEIKAELSQYAIRQYLEKPYHIRDLTGMVDAFFGFHGDMESEDTRLQETVEEAEVDHQIIQQLLRDLPLQLLHRFLDRIQEDLPAEIEAMRASFKAGDRETLKRKAHTLKGNLGQVGLRLAQQVAYLLEQEAASIDADLLETRLNSLVLAHDKGQQAVRKRYG